MRDYKHVKVPRRYRSSNTRATAKRAVTGPASRGRGGSVGRSLRGVLAVLLAAAFGYGGWEGYQWVTHAELFQIAGVDVRGVRAVSDDEVRELAATFTGQNVFQADIGAAARRAMANPWVREVRIERRLPNRISMVFTEREPRAVLQAANGRYLIDRDGVVIVPAAKTVTEAQQLPVIAIRSCRAAPRETVTAGAMASALELLDELAVRGGWDPGAVTVRADSMETVTVVYADHEFRIGSGNYPEKLRRLGEIVSDMQRRGYAFSSVELRPERQAAVMIAKSAKVGR